MIMSDFSIHFTLQGQCTDVHTCTRTCYLCVYQEHRGLFVNISGNKDNTHCLKPKALVDKMPCKPALFMVTYMYMYQLNFEAQLTLSLKLNYARLVRTQVIPSLLLSE